MEDLSGTIARIKPLADEVVERAAALNLAVRLDVVAQGEDGDGEPVPALRARISKRLA